MVLVDRKTDGFKYEISLDIKKCNGKGINRNQRLLSDLFLDIRTNFILGPVSFSVNKYHRHFNLHFENVNSVIRTINQTAA